MGRPYDAREGRDHHLHFSRGKPRPARKGLVQGPRASPCRAGARSRSPSWSRPTKQVRGAFSQPEAALSSSRIPATHRGCEVRSSELHTGTTQLPGDRGPGRGGSGAQPRLAPKLSRRGARGPSRARQVRREHSGTLLEILSVKRGADARLEGELREDATALPGVAPQQGQVTPVSTVQAGQQAEGAASPQRGRPLGGGGSPRSGRAAGSP